MCRTPAPSALCLGQEHPQCKARLTSTESRRSLLRRPESEVRARAISRLVSSADGASWGPETLGRRSRKGQVLGRPCSALHSGLCRARLLQPPLPDSKEERCPEQLKTETQCRPSEGSLMPDEASKHTE